MSHGKLLKTYLKLDSFNKKLALLEEYNKAYLSTPEQI